MTNQAITFDFHNTLASCPEWFEFEVRRLPSAFLRWRAAARAAQLDAALADIADARYRELRRDIIEHGNELTAEACLHTVFAALSVAIPAKDIDEGVEHVMRSALAGASPVPGAVETVHAIHEAGVSMGIVSSAVYHPFLEWTLSAFGIRNHIKAIITSASAGFYKSRPELYWHAADVLQVTPDSIVHVGDSLRFDVGGANRAGMGTVWLQANGAVPGEHAIVPDLTVRSLEAAAPEILALLRARVGTMERPRGRD